MITAMFLGKKSFGYKFTIGASMYGVVLYVFTLLGLSVSGLSERVLGPLWSKWGCH